MLTFIDCVASTKAGRSRISVWVPGNQNPADALTKPNAGATADLLEKLLVDGRLPVAVKGRRSVAEKRARGPREVAREE